MENLWSDREAEAAVARYGAKGAGRDLALRVYTTRLLGGEPRLVLHGGGNTSLKTRMTDLAGDEAEVLCVKGSGWDMARIEPAGLPAVRLDPLRRLRRLDALPDEDMVAAHRTNLLDPSSPTPSVETLLHAFLPHRYIDHTHANAVLALTDQPDGAALCREVFGESVVTRALHHAGLRACAESGGAVRGGARLRGDDPAEPRRLQLRRDGERGL